MKGLRPILPLSLTALRGVRPAPIVGEPPEIAWVNPRDLFVEEDYQREIGEKSVKLIRNIYSAFSWHLMKPPICFRAEERGDVLVVIDGQHTAIAAASRRIDRIPVLVFANATLAQRAVAFVGHNVNRVALTGPAIYRAAVAHGDAVAIEMRSACEESGVTILTQAIDLSRERPVGETIAIGAIRSTLMRRGRAHLVRVLRVLVAAGRGPVKAQEITAASIILLLFPREPNVDARLAEVVRSKNAKAWGALAATLDGALPQALATCWQRALDLREPEAAERKSSAPAAAKPVVRAPAAPPPPPRPAADPRPRPTVFLAQANGITVTMDGDLARNGWSHTARLGRMGGAMLARLVTVMPAQIGFDRLAALFSGKPNARVLVEDLVAACNPDLRRVGLEIFTVRGSGYILRDLANIGENLLRA
jgi:hypothetical protein